MPTTPMRTAIVRSVIEGKTFQQIGADLGRSASWVSQHFNAGCRQLGLEHDPRVMRKHPQQYLAKLGPEATLSVDGPPGRLKGDLAHALGMKAQQVLTPEAVSRYSAAQLLELGITPISVADVQDWLRKHHLRLARGPLADQRSRVAVRRALSLLDAFHFDVSVPQEQFADEFPAG